MSNNISFNVQFSGYTNFTASFPPSQLVTVLNTSNPSYPRYCLLTGDSVRIVYYTYAVTIPLSSIYQAAFSASSVLTYPPIIVTQPSASLQSIVHPGTASFYISASAETPVSYQWYTQPSGSTSWFLPTSSAGNYYYNGTSSMGFTASYVNNTIPYYNYECVVSNTSGDTTSSIATLNIT